MCFLRFLVRQSWHWKLSRNAWNPKNIKKHLFFNVFGEPILALEAPWGLKKCPPPQFQIKMFPPPPSTRQNHKFHWKSSPRCSEGYICEAGPMMGPLKYYSTSTIVLMSIGPIIKWSKRMPPRRQRILDLAAIGLQHLPQDTGWCTTSKFFNCSLNPIWPQIITKSLTASSTKLL